MTIAEIAAQREYNYGRMTIGECIAVADRGEGIGRRGDHNGGVRRYREEQRGDCGEHGQGFCP